MLQSKRTTSFCLHDVHVIVTVKKWLKRESLIDVLNQATISCGYKKLRPEQAIIVTSFVRGNNVFSCLPTAFGKSLCFFL